ncbi:MAG: class I SAM-dependent methyltransferase [Verrucomicrobia bacterium]|nr:class I SAM-dependent methyltransferase [Verrucomicrobiota bacterium]
MTFDLASTRERWDENSDEWTRGVRAGLDVYRRSFHDPAFTPLVGPVAGLDVLDAGAGEGIVARRLAEAGARVTAVELSPSLVEAAKTEAAARGLDGVYLSGSFTDLRALGLADGAFDRVLSVMAWMDCPDVEGAGREAFRVLRPGGRLVISVRHPVTDRPDGDARYFRGEPWVDEWAFRGAKPGARPFRIATFPRTVSGYVTALLDAGFVLEALSEPRPSEEACAEHPRLLPWRDAPFYLMLAARRR